MNCALKFFVMFALAGFFSLQTFVTADEIASEEASVDKMEIMLTLEHDPDKSNLAGPYRATGDLGKLPAGRKVEVTVTIINPADVDLPFSVAHTNCSCSEFLSDSSVIPQLGSLEGKFLLDLPAKSNTPVYQATIRLANTDPSVPGVHLTFSGELQGLLGFSKRLGVLEFGEEETVKTVRIPFVATDPVKVEGLVVTASENLTDVDFQVKRGNEGQHFVEGTIAKSLISEGGVSGEVFLADTQSTMKDGFMLTINHSRNCKISPSFIRFSRKPESDDLFQATVIVQTKPVRPSEQGRDRTSVPDGQETESSASIAARFNDTLVDLKKQKLVDGVYRVTLTAHLKQLKAASETMSLKWRIRDGGEKPTRLSTRFSVSE